MDSFFLMVAKPLVQDSPTMRLHELLDWDESRLRSFEHATA
jgi:IS5 family transposase